MSSLTHVTGVGAAPSQTRSWFRQGWWALILLECGANALGVVAPLDRDEGAFLVIAQEILRGHVPYRDVFDQKAPAIYYLLALLLWLTPRLGVVGQIITLRLAATLANALTALGLARLGQRWDQPTVGRVAALFWLGFSALGIFGANQLFTEPFATAATVWAIAQLARRLRWWSVLEAGSLLALGTLFKQTAILALPVMLVMVWFQARVDGIYLWRRMRMVGFLLASLAAPWLLIGAAFAVAGAFNQFFYQVITANLVAYPPTTGFSNKPLAVAFYLLLIALGPLTLTIARLIYNLRRRGERSRRQQGRALLVALLALLPVFPFIPHPYPHYLIQALPWLAFLLALGVCGSLNAVEPIPGQRMRLALASALALSIFTAVSLAIPSLSVNRAQLMRQVAAGAAIARVTGPSARLLIAPADPEYYYLSGRAPVTSYIYLLPINRAQYPIAQVTNDIRARRFDVVVWLPNTVQSDSPTAFAVMFSTLRQSYTTVSEPIPAIEIFAR